MGKLSFPISLLSGAPVATYTAAQLSAMAAAGTLTPFATYVPSDARTPYQLWARDPSTLGSPLGCDLVETQYADATGLTIEVLP